MSRNRSCLTKPDLILHAYNWGIDRRRLFYTKQQYEWFLQLLKELQKKHAVSVLVYVLVPTQFDLILQQHERRAVSGFMQHLCHDFAWLLNRCLHRRGLLFDGRYRSDPVHDPEELTDLSCALHCYPLRYHAVKNLDQWLYSSRDAYYGRTTDLSVDTSLILKLVGGAAQYRRLSEHFDPASPGMVQTYLCRDAASIWAARGVGKRNGNH